MEYKELKLFFYFPSLRYVNMSLYYIYFIYGSFICVSFFSFFYRRFGEPCCGNSILKTNISAPKAEVDSESGMGDDVAKLDLFLLYQSNSDGALACVIRKCSRAGIEHFGHCILDIRHIERTQTGRFAPTYGCF